MKKVISIPCALLIALLCVSKAEAQLVINGGSLTIGDNAIITVEGDCTNTGGTITNNGKLEVKGSFSNTGTYTATASDDSLLLTGTGNVTLTPGTSPFNYLQINKTGGGTVTLAGNATVNNKLDFLAGNFSTNPATAFELIAPAAAVLSYAAGTEVTGKVRRNGWVNGTSKNFNSTNMLVTTTGGTNPTSMLVNMIPNGDPTGAEREVKRVFNFTPTSGTGYTANVTFPYKEAGELNTNTEANLVPWYLLSTEWNGKLTGNAVNAASDFVTSTGLDATTFSTSQWKLADPVYSFNVTALLRGPWNGTTMNTTLNSSGLIPLTQPYNTAPYNSIFGYAGTESVAAIPNANIVDWVLLELRKPTSSAAVDAGSSTIVGRKAVFVRNDGVLVDLNGTAIPSFAINKQGTSFVVVRFRNHLGVMSNGIPSNATGTFTNDFSASLANTYKDPGAPSDPVTVLAGGKFGLWAGNVNTNPDINAGDVSGIKLATSNSVTGYQIFDVNLNGDTNAGDAALVKVTIGGSGAGSVPARIANGKVVSSLPK